MGSSWRIGRVAGINVFLHPTLLFLVAYALWVGGVDYLLLIAALFGCVVLHELGHALTARRLGIPTRDIILTPIGGVARLDRMPRAPGAELLITLAGPLVNVAIAAALWGVLSFTGAFAFSRDAWTYLDTFGFNLMIANVVLAVFNMIPVFPMDGGRVLRAALSGAIGHRRATEIAAGLGRILAVALGVFGLVRGDFMLAVLAAFIFMAGGAELAAVRREEDDRQDGGSDGGSDGEIWTAPAGYRWVSRGQGVWQLAPIHVNAERWGSRQWR
jgi:Zn-dependent protease